MKSIIRIGFSIIRSSIMAVLFLSMFTLMIASHVVPAVALLTGKAIYAISGVTSAALTADELSAQNRQLRTDLANRHRAATAAETERKALQLELDSARTRLSATHAELANHRTEADRLKTQLARKTRYVTVGGVRMSETEALKRTLANVSDRTRKASTANLSSTAGEAIPFYGIGIILGVTAYELNMACNNMREIYDLSVAIDPESAIPDDRDEVCGLQVPTREEVWDKILSSPESAWRGAVKTAESGGKWLSDLEAPSFDGVWKIAINTLDSVGRIFERELDE